MDTDDSPSHLAHLKKRGFPFPACALILFAPLALAQKIEVIPVQGNIYMLAGAGGNILTLQLGDNGVLAVDTGLPPNERSGDRRNPESYPGSLSDTS